MFKDNLLEALRRNQKESNPDRETSEAIDKIQNEKRLSREEFLRVFDVIRKDGPITKYQTPDSWPRSSEEK